MRTHSITYIYGIILLAALAVGCSDPQPPPQPPPQQQPEAAEEPTEFSFADKSVTVSADELRESRKKTIEQAGAGSQNLSVLADFNQDGLKDLALVEPGSDEDDISRVTVYIRKAGESGDGKVFYYRGGAIPAPGTGEIKGIMERRGKFTDLVILADSDIVLYRNDGNKFVKQED